MSGKYKLIGKVGGTIHVSCDMNRNDGQWMVIQRRCDGSLSQLTDRHRKFKKMAGKNMMEFFRGVDNIEILMEGSKQTKMLVVAEDKDGRQYIAKYSYFYIIAGTKGRYLRARGYQGNLGNVFEDGSERNNDMDCNTDNTVPDILKCSIFRLNVKWDNGIKWTLPGGNEVMLVKTEIMIQTHLIRSGTISRALRIRKSIA